MTPKQNNIALILNVDVCGPFGMEEFLDLPSMGWNLALGLYLT
jgi:hypothetical protein